MPPLRTYQIPIPKEETDIYETRKAAQDLIDQAEEDLFCAIGCLRHNLHEPLNEICYLLHQALEKWIKVAHQMNFGRYPYTHDLQELLEPFQAKELDANEPEELDLREVMSELSIESVITDKKYPDRVRYRHKLESKYSLNAHVDFLLLVIFLTRRLVKRWLKTRENGG